MRRKAVAVAPHSPSDVPARPDAPCAACGARGNALEPLCGACGALGDVPAGASHFAILGFAERLLLDESALRDRFYELSKKTHPDRFSGAAGRLPAFAERWSTAVNRAYQTLRDPVKRSRYLLELHGRSDDKAKLPLDLAEAYFEIQEGDSAALTGFRAELDEKRQAAEAEWSEIAKLWDTDQTKALDALAANLTRRKYLSSMIADIERKLEMAEQGVRDGDHNRRGHA